MDPYSRGVIGHRMPTEHQRLRLVERTLDPRTRALVDSLGLPPTARCVDLGAGAGSVARWLAERFPLGHVVATDTATDFLDAGSASNLKIVRHDVTRDDFPSASFDLVHTRWLLANLPDREAVLARIARWVAPGGWLLVEEPAMVLHDSSPYPDFRRLMDAFEHLLGASHGGDTRWARRLPASIARTGLEPTGMLMSMLTVGDRGPSDDLYRIFMAQLRPAFVKGGLVTEEEYERAIAVLDEPGFLDVTTSVISVKARRPGGPDPAPVSH